MCEVPFRSYFFVNVGVSADTDLQRFGFVQMEICVSAKPTFSLARKGALSGEKCRAALSRKDVLFDGRLGYMVVFFKLLFFSLDNSHPPFLLVFSSLAFVASLYTIKTRLWGIALFLAFFAPPFLNCTFLGAFCTFFEFFGQASRGKNTFF